MKPFNCFACLSFWITMIVVILHIIFFDGPIYATIYPFASFLIADLIFQYEQNL